MNVLSVSSVSLVNKEASLIYILFFKYLRLRFLAGTLFFWTVLTLHLARASVHGPLIHGAKVDEA